MTHNTRGKEINDTHTRGKRKININDTHTREKERHIHKRGRRIISMIHIREGKEDK